MKGGGTENLPAGRPQEKRKTSGSWTLAVAAVTMSASRICSPRYFQPAVGTWEQLNAARQSSPQHLGLTRPDLIKTPRGVGVPRQYELGCPRFSGKQKKEKRGSPLPSTCGVPPSTRRDRSCLCASAWGGTIVSPPERRLDAAEIGDQSSDRSHVAPLTPT